MQAHEVFAREHHHGAPIPRPHELAGSSIREDLDLVRRGILDRRSFALSHGMSPSGRIALPSHIPAPTLRNPLAAIVRDADGRLKQVSYQYNTRTNLGRDWQSRMMGGGINAGVAGTTLYGGRFAYTGSSSTGLTGLTGLTANALQGYMAVADGLFGSVISTTTTAITVDQWTNAGTLATGTPAGTGNVAFVGGAPGYWMSLANASLTINATDTVLGAATTNEYNASGLTRALATMAHTAAGTTFTETITFTCTSGPQTVFGSGLHYAGVSRNTNPDLVFENNFTASAVLQTSDTLQDIWTITIG